MKTVLKIVFAFAVAWTIVGCTETLNDFNVSADKWSKENLRR
jgi:hypothetical protein